MTVIPIPPFETISKQNEGTHFFHWNLKWKRTAENSNNVLYSKIGFPSHVSASTDHHILLWVRDEFSKANHFIMITMVGLEGGIISLPLNWVEEAYLDVVYSFCKWNFSSTESSLSLDGKKMVSINTVCRVERRVGMKEMVSTICTAQKEIAFCWNSLNWSAL